MARRSRYFAKFLEAKGHYSMTNQQMHIYIYICSITLLFSSNVSFTSVAFIRMSYTIHGTYNAPYRIYKSPHISEFWSTQTQTTHLHIIWFKSSWKLPAHPHSVYPKGLFPSDYSTKNFTPIHDLLVQATCFFGLILMGLIILTKFCEDYELFFSYWLLFKTPFIHSLLTEYSVGLNFKGCYLVGM
jgi:hypothetical protein